MPAVWVVGGVGEAEQEMLVAMDLHVGASGSTQVF